MTGRGLCRYHQYDDSAQTRDRVLARAIEMWHASVHIHCIRIHMCNTHTQTMAFRHSAQNNITMHMHNNNSNWNFVCMRVRERALFHCVSFEWGDVESLAGKNKILYFLDSIQTPGAFFIRVGINNHIHQSHNYPLVWPSIVCFIASVLSHMTNASICLECLCICETTHTAKCNGRDH